jgi:hypothetical protein
LGERVFGEEICPGQVSSPEQHVADRLGVLSHIAAAANSDITFDTANVTSGTAATLWP